MLNTPPAQSVNFIKNVVRIDRSPMNEKIWCIQLECNHDVFVTSKHKPSRKRMHCEKCQAKAVRA